MALWNQGASIGYSCLRFIEEWAHPLININFTLIGLSSGLVLNCALAGLCEDIAMVQAARPWALIVSLLAWPPLALPLRRNARLLAPKVGAATRHRHPRQRPGAEVREHIGGHLHNSREFFHGAKQLTLSNAKHTVVLLACVFPCLLLNWALASQTTLPLLVALLMQAPGLIAER